MWTNWNWAIPLTSTGWTSRSRFSQSISARIRIGTSYAAAGVYTTAPVPEFTT